MATPQDGAAGYRLYADSEGTLALAEINEWLTSNGFGAVSFRMYRHFQKLYRLGHRAYMPINRLDVLTSQDPIWDPKFRVNEATTIEEPVSLRFSVASRVVEIEGIATEISEFGFLVIFDALALRPVLENASLASASVSARFRERDAVNARLVGWSVNQKRNEGRARFVFEEFGAFDRVSPIPNIGTVSFRITFGTADTVLLVGQVAQVMFWTNQAFEAAGAAAAVMSGARYPHPVLRRLRFGSELQVIGEAALEAVEVLGVVWGLLRSPQAVIELAKSWEDLLERRDNRRKRRDPEHIAREGRIEEASARKAELDVERTEVEVATQKASSVVQPESDRVAGRLFGARYDSLTDEEKVVVQRYLIAMLRAGDEARRVASPVRLSVDAADHAGELVEVTLDDEPAEAPDAYRPD